MTHEPQPAHLQHTTHNNIRCDQLAVDSTVFFSVKFVESYRQFSELAESWSSWLYLSLHISCSCPHVARVTCLESDQGEVREIFWFAGSDGN